MLLALFMILTSFPMNAFAAQKETSVRNEITDIKTVGDKQVINLGTVKGKSSFRFFSRSARLFGATTQQARSSSETVAQNVEINLETLGLNLGDKEFDPSALTEAGSFDVNITFKELGGKRTETRTMTFQAGETKKTETFYLPKDMGQGVVEAEIPKLKDTIALRVYVSANNTTNFNLGQDMTYKFELSQIVHPVIDLKVVDPYGKELADENIAQALELKLALEDEYKFDLPANTKTFNIRSLSKFAGNNIEDLNSAGDDPKLSLTTQLRDKKLTVGNKTYKLNKITYNALGQEVEINGQKKKVGGYIEFATQPKIIVPTPDEGGGLPKTPDGYKRLSFYAETSANAQDGRFENGEKLKVIDVLEGTEYTDTDLQNQIKGIGQPTPIIYGRKDDNKKFLKWKPELPTKGAVADTDFYPVYLKDGGEITPGEKLPDGVFEVKVVKDNTIAADPLYGKSYGVFQGSKLARDKFPDLEAKKGHQNPKWTTEAEDPTNGMVDIAKPWTKVITKATTFKATAAEDAATQIGKNGLKPEDIPVLQGHDMTEADWHKGVALADNTPTEKKAEFAALLKEATVTDASNPARTTAEAGDKVGTLLVTFKDGSTLEVPNQKLIVKPNTVEVSFDNEAGDDANAPRHKETVVKGKVTSTSGYPVKGAKVEIKDESGKVIGITQVIDDEGNFKAGTRELKAGEKLTASVTLPDSKLAAESKEKTVKLNADRLKDLLPIAKAQKENFSKKQNAFIKEKLEALDKAITEAEKLVDKNGKAVGDDTAKNQTAIDTAVTNLENALKALTANIPPSISGPKTHEIFVGEALDLKKLVDVTDGDGADDLVLENGSNVKITAKKVDGQTETPVADLTTIKDTVGTYKVTYTAKDKSDAKVTHEMTLTVKTRTNSAIEVTKDPSNMKYLITEKGGKAKLNLEGMTLNLVDNLGKKTEVKLNDPKVKFKVSGKEIKDGGDLTLADDVKFIEVEYTPEGSQTPLKAQTKGVLRVGPDYDGDKKDDRTQNFDPEKIEKLEVIKQPQLDYIAKDKSEDSKFKLNLEGMIVRMTDKAGKEKLAVVKNDGKFYDYDEPTKEITQLTATPAHGAKLIPQTGTEDAQKGDNGKTVEIKSTNGKTTNTEPLKVFYDANKDGEPDYKEGQKTPAPSAMARNVGENPQGTTVEGMATPGAVIKITDKDGNALTTEPTEIKAGPDGKYTATVKPILADGTEIKVTAKLGEMGESDPTPTKVFDDKNNNKQPDRDEGFNIEKATDIKFVDQPDLTYLVKTKDTEVTFDGKDAKGKAIYLELSYKNGDKTESKIMTLEDLIKDTDHISVTPANGTKDKKENQTHELVGKAIEVKLVKVDPATATSKATSTSKFAIEIDADGNGKADKDEKTPAPTAKALNVGKNPTSTTITGKAVPGAKVVAKVGETVVGETTADKTTGEYTINATKDGAALPKDTKVNVTAKDGEKQTSDSTEAIVKEDKDGNGVDDDKEKFNIKKATKVEIIKNPDKMDYLVNTPEGKAKFETAGLVVKFTDDSGKSATYTAEELANMSDVTIKPANNEEIGLTSEGKTNKMDLTVTVTGAEATDKPTAKADRQVIVKLDADGNKTADEDEQTPEPTVTARNIGTDGPDGKKVPATKTTVEIETVPKAKVTIEYTDKDGQPQKIENLTAGEDGKLTQEITPKLKEGTDVKVTVQDGEKKPAEKTVKVFDDLDNNKIPDNQAGQTERPAAIASNKGKKPAFTTIEGKTEKGAVITVTVKVNGEEKPVTVENLKVNDDGTYTLEAKYNNKPLENGAEILVYAENAPKTISKPQTTTVFNDVNEDGKPDAGKVDLTDVKDIQVIAPDKMSYTQGDKLDGTGLKAVVRDNKGGIEIFDYDNKAGKFKNADNEEVADITATVANKPIKDLALTKKDHDGKAIDVKVGGKTGSTNQKLDVKQLQTPTPTIEFAANQNTVGSDGVTATGTAKNFTTVKFTVKNKPTTVYVKYTVNGEAKEESFEIGANDDATKTVDLQVKLPVGAEVQVLAKDADKTLSKPATEKVVRDANNDGTADDKTPVGNAKIDPIKAQSEQITVKPADNATELVIKETDKSGNPVDGSTPITVTKDKEGNWKIGDTLVEKDEETGKLTIITKDKLKLDEYNVVEVESKGDPDTTTPSTAKEVVGEAADTTAPEKPVVDQPVDGDKDIKVKTPTDKDAKTITVEIVKPSAPGEKDKTEKVVVTKGDDGKWKTPDGKDVPEENGKLVIPVPEVKTGDTATVEVKDDSGNHSESDPQTVVERQKLPQPTIDPIKTGGKTVAGKAEKAETVNIYKKNAEGGYDKIVENVGVSPDGSYTYNNPEGFKDGDVIRVVANKPGMTSNSNETTVGVDTTALDKAIQDGKDALDPEKGGKNNGTKADKDLEKAIQEGEDLKKKDPAPTQKEVDAAKDKIEKAIEEKKETDKALDELKKAQEELDNAIKEAEKERKPKKDIKEAKDTNTKAKDTIEKKDKNSTDIKDLIKEVEEQTKQMKKPVVMIDVIRAIDGEDIILFKTNPGQCIVKIIITHDDGTMTELNTETAPDGNGSIRLKITLKAGEFIDIEAKDKKGNYLDGYTPANVNI